MSKIESGASVIKNRSFNLHNLLDEIREMMLSETDKKDLAVHLLKSNNLPQFIVSDDAKLRQILLNLLGNSSKFTTQGSITLTATSKTLNRNNTTSQYRQPHFTVVDTGIGIPSADLEEIFDPFVQKQHDTSSVAGSGLGLTICRHLVRMLVINIAVQSTWGKGFTFSFNSMAESAKIPAAESDIKPYGQITGLLPGPPCRLMVVENNIENRELLRMLLQQVSFDMIEAQNGPEAVGQYIHYQPDLVWMDIRMPVMDGFEATQKIRKLEQDGGHKVVIIALTVLIPKQ